MMPTLLSFLRKVAFVAAALLLWQGEAHATHAMGGELTYTCLGNNRWEVKLNFYRDCNGVAAPTNCNNGLQFRVRSQSCGANFTDCFNNATRTVEDITPICDGEVNRCNSAQGTYGVQKYTWTKIVDLSSYASCGGNDWYFEWSLCCRNNAITSLQSPGSKNLFLDARLNKAPGLCNSSPVFTNSPAPFYCLGEPISYNPGAVDADGDSLVYSLVQPRHSRTETINYRPNYTLQNPIRNTGGANAVTLDPQTGTMTVTPSVIQVAVITYKVDEYRDGVLVGSITRDVQFVIRACTGNTAPTVSGINGSSNYSMQVCAGTPVSFTVNSYDANATDVVTMSWNSGISGGTFTVSGSPHPVGTFTWTPTVANIGNNTFTVHVEDDGCPLKGVNDYGFSILVTPPATDVDAGDDFAVCGTSATMNAPPLPYSGLQGTWSVVSGSGTFANPNSRTSAVSGLSPGPNVFQWTVNYQTCGTRSDQVTVTSHNASQPAASAGPDQEICGPPNQVTLSANTATAPAVGTWTFVSGSGTITNPNAPNTTVTGLAFGTNRLRWTIDNGPCGNTQSEVEIKVYNSDQAQANAGSNINICTPTSSVTLNGNAVTAPAVGTWTSVSGGGTITNPNQRNTTVTGLAVGVHVFRWTISNGPCTPGSTSDEVTVTVYDNNSASANAGPDQEVCGTGSVTLAGNSPIFPATGQWTVVSGSGTFTSPSSPTTTVTGLGIGNNIFEWTVNNGPCASGVSSDQVTITAYDETVSGANAGPDRSFCLPTTTVTMQANAPAAPAQGTWTLVSGSGTITNPNLATTTVTGLAVGENVFQWAITNGPCQVTPPSDLVSIFIYDNNAPAANAGPDQQLCTPTTATVLAGNAPTFPATGQWTVVNGSGSFADANNPTTGVTGLSLGVNTFRWTINNGPCANPTTQDDVVITVYSSDNAAANAGPDQDLCTPTNSTTLAGSAVIAPATGTWTLVSGTGTIVSPNSPTTQVTGLGVGDNYFRWTVLNGACAGSNTSDDVRIRVFDSSNPVADAGPDQQLCSSSNNTTLVGSNIILPAAGVWTLQSGGGTIVTPNSPSTAVNNLPVGVNIFRWTVSNGTCDNGETWDEVAITVYDDSHAPITVSADQSICVPTDDNSVSVTGTAPTFPATGQWTVVAGSGTITDPTSATTTITDMGVGVNVFQWTVTNGPCAFPDNSAQVSVSVHDATMSTADAGPDQSLCTPITSTTLAGSAVIAPGTGQWSVLAGTGVFANANDPNTTVSNLSLGDNIFVWSVDNGPCAAPSSDQVTISVFNGNAQQADAGADQELCSDDATAVMAANAPASTAFGFWSVTQGTAVFADVNDHNTTVTGLSIGVNILVWSIDNGACGTSSDQVRITVFDVNNPAVDAGPDQQLCTPTTATTLAGSAVNAPATGTWTLVSGQGNIVSPNDPGTQVNNLGLGDNVFRWTVDNGACSGVTFDEVIVSVYSGTAQQANAGPGQDLCWPVNTAELEANIAVFPGIGTWSAGAGITFSDPSSPTATVSGLAIGDNILTWTIDNGPCGTSSSQVNIRVFDNNNPVADAGQGQELCSPTDFTEMTGSTVTYPAIGQWILVSGAGTIANPSSPTTAITDLAVGANVFRWTVDNGPCGPSTSSEVTITLFDSSVSGADAGPDQSLCTPQITATMAASAAPSPAQGTWELVSGGGNITDIHSPTTTITDLPVGANIFRWTVTNGTCPVNPPSSEVTILVYDENNAAADAGPDQEFCTPVNSVTLAGNAPIFPATGTWTLVQGQGVITDATDPATTVTGLAVGENIFEWTVLNGPCADPETKDRVSIFVFDENNAAADAGPDQELCTPANSTTLAGNAPIFPAAGTWTLVQGQGVITNPANPTTTVTGLGVGENIFMWTVDNGPCGAPTTSEVSIFLFDSNTPNADAGPDQELCLPTTTTTMAGSLVIAPATGEWTLVSGSGDIADPSDPLTGITGLAVGANVFRWTVSNGQCSTSSSEVTIFVYDDANLAADAGPDQEICTPASTVTMAGSAVTFPAVGTWTLVSGSGVITNPNDPGTTVIDMPVGTHVFQWTVDNGPCGAPTSSTMTVEVFDRNNPVADAGDDVEMCSTNSTSHVLNGSAVISPAVGTWAVQQGAGTFDDIHDPQTTVSGLAVGVNILRWTVYNGTCQGSETYDEVTITLYDGNNDAADAGPDRQHCTPTSSTFLEGNVPTFPATGQWTLVSGHGVIADPFDPHSEVTDLEVGVNIFEWTVDNGPCGSPTSSQVRITVFDDATPAADAGPDQQVCTPVTSATLAGSDIIFPAVGTWVLVSGQGTITDENDPNTTVTDLGIGVNVFEWRVDNGPCRVSTDQVTITLFDLNAPPADAGDGDSFCGPPAAPVQLNANAPTPPAVGAWSVAQGTGSFSDVNDPNATVSGMEIGANIYTWSFDNGICGFTESNVTFLVYDPNNEAAFAGLDQEYCTPQDSTWLQGNTPTFPASGTWTLIDGAGLFDDPSDPNTKVVGMAIGENVFRWTTSNGPCEGSTTFDEVIITIYSDSTAAAYAGDDFEVCLPETNAQLWADIPMPPATGVWTIIDGSATLDDPTDPHTFIHGLELGITTLVWTLDNGPCPDNGIMSDTLRISVYDPFGPVAEAGDDQEFCTPDDSAVMDAVEPLFPAQGTWALVSGAGDITDVHDPHTTITGLEIGINVFSWTVYNGDCGFGPPTESEVSIYIYDASAPDADAGEDQDICGVDAVVTLDANEATYPGVGTWTSASGTVVFDDANDPTTTVSGLAQGDNLLTWTIYNGPCGTTSSTVLIRVFDSELDAADAGEGQELCTPDNSTTLNATAVAYPATGQWTVVTGSGTFADDTDPGTAVTNLGLGVNVFEWTIDNGPCGTVSDQVTITLFDGDLADAQAGPDQQHCGPMDSVTLGATSVAAPATGTWTIVSGPGTLTDPTDPNTTLTGLSTGQTVLSWTVSNGPCAGGTLTDEVVITIFDNDQAAANAGPDQDFCEPGEITVDMFGNQAVFPANGHWSIVGDANITDPSNPHTTVTGVGFGSTIMIWTIDNGECGSTSDEMTISVFDINAALADAGPDQALCHDTTYTHMAAVPATSTATGHWELIEGHGGFMYPGDHDAEVTGLELGTNIFQWVLDNGACGSSADTMLIVLRDCSILVIPDAFSPNGDGVNDIYTIEGLEYYPDNKFQVFNRWGAKVFERNPYRNTWDGTSEGKANWGTQLPESTYYFIFDPGDGQDITTGYIYLRR